MDETGIGQEKEARISLLRGEALQCQEAQGVAMTASWSQTEDSGVEG